MDGNKRKKTFKRKCISINDKVAILDRLNSGESIRDISKNLDLNESTLRTIRKNESKIRKTAGTNCLPVLSKTARIKDPLLSKMEVCLSIWINECKQKNIYLTNNNIKRRACEMYAELKQSAAMSLDDANKYDFKGSQGWFERFRKRFSLHDIQIKDDDHNSDDVIQFKEQFSQIVEEEGYTDEQVFNADETVLFWKKMPRRTFISKCELSDAGFKYSNEMITLLFCSNASGKYLMKPLLIQPSLNSVKQEEIDNLSTLPVYWETNDKATMTAVILKKWFYNCFVPDVEIYLRAKNCTFKALLIVDNVTEHLTDLVHENVKVLYLPSSTSSILQPLEQDVPKLFKCYYIRRTLEFIFDRLNSNPSTTVIQIWKEFSILNCVKIIDFALKELMQSTLNTCWRELWSDVVVTENYLYVQSMDTSGILSVAKKLGGEGFDDMNHAEVIRLIENRQDVDNGKHQSVTTSKKESSPKRKQDNSSSGTETNVSVSLEVLNEGLDLFKKAETFIVNMDPLLERSSRFQKKLQQCLAPYLKLKRKLEGTATDMAKDDKSVTVKDEPESESEAATADNDDLFNCCDVILNEDDNDL